MRDHIRERVLMLGNYIVESGATVRQTACRFGVSKSTVHTVVTKQNAGTGTNPQAFSLWKKEIRCSPFGAAPCLYIEISL